LGVTGGGSVDSAFGVTSVNARVIIQPDKTGTVRITTSPNEPGNYEFRFWINSVQQPDATVITAIDSGEVIAKLAVTR
jgi:hypothetical protein